MKRTRSGARRGFSLVELLAVVLILAVLAAVAVPLYINSRRSAAARSCIANMAAIRSAESALAVRHGGYNTTNINGNYDPANALTSGLVGAPEGLSAQVFCPLDGITAYTITSPGGDDLQITCANAPAHDGVVDDPADYIVTMAAPATETLNP